VSVSRGRRDRTRGPVVRVALRQYDAAVPLDGDRANCEGWLGAWHEDGNVSLAGGAYLASGVPTSTSNPTDMVENTSRPPGPSSRRRSGPRRANSRVTPSAPYRNH